MVALRIRDAANTLRTAASIKMRDATGALRTATTIKMRDAANMLRTVWSAGGLGITPSFVSGFGSSDGAIFVTSDRASINGAPAGATIVWHCDNPSITIVTPNANSTLFRAHLGSGVTEAGTAYATVNGAPTNSINVELTNGGIA